MEERKQGNVVERPKLSKIQAMTIGKEKKRTQMDETIKEEPLELRATVDEIK